MQFLDAPLRIARADRARVARQRGFEFRRDQLGEVAAHALGHAAFGFAGDPDEQRDLQDQRDGEKENEAEADAPVEAAREGPRSADLDIGAPCSRCPTPSG